MATFTLEPLAGKGVLAWPLDTAMAMVDHMLGGSGAADQPNRPMTGMESAITGHLLDRLLGELGEAFAPVTSLSPALDSVEYNPQLAQAASGVGDGHGGDLQHAAGDAGARRHPGAAVLLLRRPAEQRRLPAAVGVRKHKRQRALEAITERLGDVPVDVSVRFNPLEVPSGDLLSLAVGDVLLLRHAQDSPLQVTTNDVTFAHALPSNHRRRLAAEIVPDTTSGAKDLA